MCAIFSIRKSKITFFPRPLSRIKANKHNGSYVPELPAIYQYYGSVGGGAPMGKRTQVLGRHFKKEPLPPCWLRHIKQIDSMLQCVYLVIDHRWRQNVVRTSKTHSAIASRVIIFCSYHILTSSVVCYWTVARQHGIYLLSRINTLSNK